MHKTQLQWTMDMLLKRGEVSRNSALSRRITRLGARINDLKRSGWNIEGKYLKEKFGRDYIYHLIGKTK